MPLSPPPSPPPPPPLSLSLSWRSRYQTEHYKRQSLFPEDGTIYTELDLLRPLVSGAGQSSTVWVRVTCVRRDGGKLHVCWHLQRQLCGGMV